MEGLFSPQGLGRVWYLDAGESSGLVALFDPMGTVGLLFLVVATVFSAVASSLEY